MTDNSKLDNKELDYLTILLEHFRRLIHKPSEIKTINKSIKLVKKVLNERKSFTETWNKGVIQGMNEFKNGNKLDLRKIFTTHQKLGIELEELAKNLRFSTDYTEFSQWSYQFYFDIVKKIKNKVEELNKNKNQIKSLINNKNIVID